MLPRFYPILDTATVRGRGASPIEVAEALLEAGVKILQFRHKAAWTQLDYDEAERVCALCRDAGALFVMNDRADYAKLLGVALHLGQDDLPPVAARKIVGDTPIGLSTHNRRQVSFGNDEPVDYLALGPIFTTSSKQNPDPVVGLDGLQKLRPLTTKPLVAIGGITLENAAATLAAGADSVAVISGCLPENCERSAISDRVAQWLAITR